MPLLPEEGMSQVERDGWDETIDRVEAQSLEQFEKDKRRAKRESDWEAYWLEFCKYELTFIQAADPEIKRLTRLAYINGWDDKEFGR